MSSGEENGGGRQPPPDDRTLLDPLSNDELKALREARQRMQARRAAGQKSSAIKHQIVITPSSEDGAASDRPQGPLPTFEGGDVTLEHIRVPKVDRPAPAEHEARPARPAPTESPTEPRDPAEAQATAPTGPVAPDPSTAKAGQTGFGENTLMWMQPVKPPTGAGSTAPTGQDSMFINAPKSSSWLRWVQLAGVLVVVAGLGYVLVSVLGGERGTLELHTNPGQARLFINGESSTELTPVRLTLDSGEYTLRVEKDGYEPQDVQVVIEGDTDERKDVDLVPISRAGLVTVSIEVMPIAATVTVDDATNTGVRKLHVPNLDPKVEHRIRVEAGGYLKTEQVIRPGELQSHYAFTLERDDLD